MKKIAVITSGLLPMPAVKGGAIETLLQYLIDYNEVNNDFEYEVYSIYNPDAEKASLKFKNTKFKYIKVNKVFNNIYFNIGRIARKLGYNDPNFQKIYIKKVCNILKTQEYDLVLIESDNHFVLPVKKSCTSPIVLYLHNDKLNDNVKNSKEIFNACLRILTVSDYIKNRVLTVDKNEQKVVSILNGIDTEKFKIDNKEEIRNLMRDKYNISKNDFVFLFTGRIEPNKGVLELVQSFNMIDKKHIKLVILGGSFFSSNKKTKYVKKLEEEISRNSDNIITTGYVNHNDIAKYHIMSDCMVSPSLWEEPGSLVNQEAFASGLPLISSYSGGTPEYTKNTRSILVKKDNNFIENLSKEMSDLIDNKELQIEMKNAGIKESKYFSKERYCKDLADFLKEVLK